MAAIIHRLPATRWSALVSGLVLRHHGGGDAPTLADRKPLRLGPLPNVRRLLATHGASAATNCAPTPARTLTTHRTRLGQEGRESLLKLLPVLARQVDLVARAVERKPRGSVCVATIEVIDEGLNDSLCHVGAPMS